MWKTALLQFGKTVIKNSNGTEVDRIWKIRYGLGEENIEITLHFYNHNKPKDKKTSKILIQGSSQSILCEYVLIELPNIYKHVCEKKSSLFSQTPIRQSKRKRLTTSVKKRNIKYKPTSKAESQACTLCDFSSVSNPKIIRHMKANHTESLSKIETNMHINEHSAQLAEYMSICLVSDDEDVHKC